MKSIVKIVYILISFVFLTYLLLPQPQFPPPPPNSLQSNEPADTETPLRRAYYSDLDRASVLKHYQDYMQKLGPFDLHFLTFRLNYPPEEAQILIRDQTRSTFLEEIVHPMRESLFVNGFEPKHAKDAIYINGKKWNQKVTVKMVYSNLLIRFLLGVITILFIPVLIQNFTMSVVSLYKEIKKKWIFQL